MGDSFVVDRSCRSVSKPLVYSGSDTLLCSRPFHSWAIVSFLGPRTHTARTPHVCLSNPRLRRGAIIQSRRLSLVMSGCSIGEREETEDKRAGKAGGAAVTEWRSERERVRVYGCVYTWTRVLYPPPSPPLHSVLGLLSFLYRPSGHDQGQRPGLQPTEFRHYHRPVPVLHFSPFELVARQKSLQLSL